MLSCFLNKEEINVITSSKKDNREELLGFQIPNVLFPFGVIVYSLLGYWAFSEEFKWLAFFNLLVNGSILMAAFNRMSSLISYFNKIDFNDSKKLGINLKNVKMKIQVFSIFLVLSIATLYSFQVISKPFENCCDVIIQIIISSFLFWSAIDSTKVSFLLQETFLNNTYEVSFRMQQELLNKELNDNDIKF